MPRILKNVLYRVMLPAMMVLLTVPIAARAQSVYGSLSFLVGFTSGEFHDKMKGTGFGISGSLGYHFDQVPLMVGIDGGVMTYGSEEREEPFSSSIPDVRVKVSTTNNIAQAHLLFRLQPAEGLVRPYVDGLVGVNYLFTNTSVRNKNGGEDIASSTNHDDAALSYGGGGGLMIRLYQNDPSIGVSSQGSAREILLDLGVRYLSGGEAGYLTGGSIRRENGNVIYDIITSRTDLITGRIGAVLRF